MSHDDVVPESDVPPALRDLSPPARDLSRRAFLNGTVSSAAALGLGAMWSRPLMAAPLTPASESLSMRPALLTLVNRLTNGQTEAEYAKAMTLGYSGYLASTLYPGVLDDSAFETFLGDLDPAGLLSQDPAYFALNTNLIGQAIKKVSNKAIYSPVLSVYQSRERLIEFWRDHFNVFPRKDGVTIGLTQWDRDIIRAKATGSFPNLLMSAEKHSAMEVYLDNWLNIQPVVNENLAREILELHTVAPTDPITGDPNYDEDDVLAFAKCISGWGVDTADPATSTTYGNFKFKGTNHFPGTKKVMKLPVPENLTAPTEGEIVLDSLSVPHLSPMDPVRFAMVKRTATFIAYKLCRWYLDYEPSPGLIAQIRDVYINTSGDIRAMVAAILVEANVAAISETATPSLKFRRPSQWLASVLRALQLTTAHFTPNEEELLTALRNQGNPPYGWPAPDGFADDEDTWTGALFQRWELGANLFLKTSTIADEVNISNAHLAGLLGPLNLADSIARIDVIMTGGVMTELEKQILFDYSNHAIFTLGVPAPQVRREAFMLAALSPTAMYY